MIIVPSNVSAAIAPVVFKGITATAWTSGVSTLTLPTHQSGDLILLWVSNQNDGYLPVKPASGGTVPNWTLISSFSTGAYHSLYYTVATSSNHTTGSWTQTQVLMASVLSGQNATNPIGAYLLNKDYTADGIGQVDSPVISGISGKSSSQILIFGSQSGVNWTADPITTGYTAKLSGYLGSICYRLLTQNDPSTSPESSIAIGKVDYLYRYNQAPVGWIEILA